MDGLLKEVKCTIKSLIVSCPNEITISNLNKDYKNTVGEDIPYQQLGFQDLEKFLRAIPDTLAVSGCGRDAVLNMTNTGNVDHIQSMMSKQKNFTKNLSRTSRSRSASLSQNQYKYNFHGGAMQSYNRQQSYSSMTNSKPISDVHSKYIQNTRPLANQNTRPLANQNTRPLANQNTRPPVTQNTRLPVTQNTRPLITQNTRPLVTPQIDKNLQKLMSSMDTLNVLSSQMSILQQSNSNIIKTNKVCVNNNKHVIHISNNWKPQEISSVANVVPIKPPPLIRTEKQYSDRLDIIYSPKNYNDDESAIPHGILDDKIFRCIDFPKEALPIGTKIKSAAIPETHFRRGTIFSMKITEVHSPFNFWFHFNDTKKLDDLMERLQSTYNSVASNKYRITYPIPQNYCVAKHRNLWHRAEILKEAYKSEVKVFLIDYGTTTFVPLQNIKFLLHQYGDLPAQANRGSLSHIKPTSRFWTTPSTAYLLKMSYLKLMYGQITEYNITNSVAYIVICDSTSEKDLQINRSLIQNRYAKFNPDWLTRRTEKDMNFLYDYQFPNFEILEKGTFPSFEELRWLMKQGISDYYIQQIYQEHQSKLRESPKSLQTFLQQNFIDRLVLIAQNEKDNSKDPKKINDENVRNNNVSDNSNSKLDSTNPFKTIF